MPTLNSLLIPNRPPVQGNLAEALANFLPMGGGMGQGQFPPPPPPGGFAPQAVPSYSGSSFLDPENAMPIAAALMKGPTFGDALGNAFAAYGETDKRRKSRDYLAKNFPELASFAEAGAPEEVLWRAALKKQGVGNDVTYGKAPIYGTDPTTGETVLGTIGDDGSFKKLDTGGFDVSTGIEKIDAGTQWLLYDKRSGQMIGTAPKDVEGEARAKERGKGVGEADNALRSMQSKMPGLEGVVKQLDILSGRATYTWSGQMNDSIRRQLGAEPRDSAVARQQYISMVDNQILPLLRDTFGAQFTQKEGESLRATLGNPDLHPREKQAVLKAFIEQKRRDVEALATQTGQAPAPAVPQPSAPRLRYNPETGELE